MNTKERKRNLHNQHTTNILALHSAATEKEYCFCRTGLFPVADSAS